MWCWWSSEWVEESHCRVQDSPSLRVWWSFLLRSTALLFGCSVAGQEDINNQSSRVSVEWPLKPTSQSVLFPVLMLELWARRCSVAMALVGAYGAHSDAAEIPTLGPLIIILSSSSQFFIYSRLYSIELEASPICLLLLLFFLRGTVTEPFQ